MKFHSVMYKMVVGVSRAWEVLVAPFSVQIQVMLRRRQVSQ
jgi:hypothetical protein